MVHASGPHIHTPPPRQATALDSVRADSLQATVRALMAQYPTPAEAERAGYRWFLRRAKEPRTYHYTNRQNARLARNRFDPARPTALLYKKDGDGSLRVVGVMYTAPPDATPDELDARVPIALSHWHQHVRLCFPRQGADASKEDFMGPAARFGPLGSLTTKESCEAAGGRFVQRLFGWMVHVEPESDAHSSHTRHTH